MLKKNDLLLFFLLYVFPSKFKYCYIVIPGKDRGDCICSRCQCREQYHGVNCGDFNCSYVEENICKRNGEGKCQLWEKVSRNTVTHSLSTYLNNPRYNLKRDNFYTVVLPSLFFPPLSFFLAPTLITKSNKLLPILPFFFEKQEKSLRD